MAKRGSTRIMKAVVDSLTPGQVVWDAEINNFAAPAGPLKTERFYVA